jgi:hypothetical protein
MCEKKDLDVVVMEVYYPLRIITSPKFERRKQNWFLDWRKVRRHIGRRQFALRSQMGRQPQIRQPTIQECLYIILEVVYA